MEYYDTGIISVDATPEGIRMNEQDQYEEIQADRLNTKSVKQTQLQNTKEDVLAHPDSIHKAPAAPERVKENRASAVTAADVLAVKAAAAAIKLHTIAADG
jgi:hypothetical protein